MWPNPQVTADLVTFTEEILNTKLHFLCSGRKLTEVTVDKLCYKSPSFMSIRIAVLN